MSHDPGGLSDSENIKNDPQYKKFMNNWKEMVPTLEKGEESDQESPADIEESHEIDDSETSKSKHNL